MWSTHNSKQKKRSRCCNSIAIIITFICLLAVIGLQCYYLYQKAESEGVDLFVIIWGISNMCMLFAKVLAMIYYASLFDYPWLRFQVNPTNRTLYESKISSTNKRLILFLCIYHIACFIHYLGELWYSNPIHSVSDDEFIVNVFLIVCNVAIPIAISQCCSSVILLQYELFIREITIDMRSKSDIDFSGIIKEYKTKMFKFEKECKFWQWYFGFKMFSFFTFAWLYVSVMIHSEDLNFSTSMYVIAGIIFWLSPFVELVVASCKLSYAFEAFLNQVLSVQGQYIHRNEDKDKDSIMNMNRLQECNHLYNYIGRNRMVFRLFATELNLNNAIKLSCIFLGAKMISYSIYNI